MKEKKVRLSISGRLYIAVLALSVFIIFVTGVMSVRIALSIKNEDRDTLIADIAKMLSEHPGVLKGVKNDAFPPELTEMLDNLSESFSQIDLIVICRADSSRLYHTDHSRIGGQFIGGDEKRVLEGEEAYITLEIGSLGLQRRAFHVIHDEDGGVIGFVMVSVLNSRITQVRNSIIASFLLLLLFLLPVASLVGLVFRKHLEGILLGYNPEEFVNLYIEREEVLDALEEGIFAIDTEGRVILMNSSAKRMLDLDPSLKTDGKLLSDYYPETGLPDTVKSGELQHNIYLRMKGRHIISTRIPIRRRGKIIGAVSIFRNRTEVTNLAKELTGANHMVDTLRAANHEFTNKLHVILGLLEMGETDKAKQYIQNTSLVSGQAIGDIYRRVPEASLAALLIGKMLRANELGIHFILKSDTYFQEKKNPLPSECFITLAGNLVDNAIDELNSMESGVKRIELGIYSDEGHTTLICDDTGRGIPEEVLISIYDQHTTTKGKGHGSGFYLMKQIVDQYEGTFHIDTEPGEGTSIEINLPV